MFIAIISLLFGTIMWVMVDYSGLLIAISGILLDIVFELSNINTNIKVLVHNLNVQCSRIIDKIVREN